MHFMSNFVLIFHGFVEFLNSIKFIALRLEKIPHCSTVMIKDIFVEGVRRKWLKQLYRYDGDENNAIARS